ncbi:sugar phosphate isomerase/epimerase family protein [Flavihumibacter petaseus]|nr:sugar phosphate isomerase/epimerase family protein [Flavihumibacter petaseus]
MNRRSFIRNMTLAGGAISLQHPWEMIGGIRKKTPLLSFSTLGCPKWPLEKILNTAVQFQYNGIEIRGIQGELDLPKSPLFSSPEAIKQTSRLIREKGLVIAGLGSSAELHHADMVKRQSNLDSAKRFIDLAASLGGTNVRVFPNNLPKEEEKAVVLARIAEGLQELGTYAAGKKVRVLMETHGELVWSDDILAVMKQVTAPDTGLIWDIYNMWTVSKESPAQVFAKLKPYIYHTHIKDSVKRDGKENYVLLGQGEAPLKEAITSLKASSYKGFYSFEWEKLWHPEIAEPEVAIPDFPQAFRKIWG